MRFLRKYMATGGPRAWPLPLGALGRAAGARGEACGEVRGGAARFARCGIQPGRAAPPRTSPHASPRTPAARPKWPKGRGQALGPPVAMYFHKKGVEIT